LPLKIPRGHCYLRNKTAKESVERQATALTSGSYAMVSQPDTWQHGWLMEDYRSGGLETAVKKLQA